RPAFGQRGEVPAGRCWLADAHSGHVRRAHALRPDAHAGVTQAPSAAGDRSGRPARVYLASLGLADFRNYHTLRLALEPGAVVLTGENGAGKTNLLEAVSFLSPGRGLRRATLAEVTRIGAPDGFAIHADV